MVESRTVDRTISWRTYPCKSGGALCLIDETFKVECLACHHIDVVTNPLARDHVDLPPITLRQHLHIWWHTRRFVAAGFSLRSMMRSLKAAATGDRA